MATSTVEHPKVVSRAEWLAARREHLKREKELTRAYDELARQRRELPGFLGLNFDVAALPLTLSRSLVASASSVLNHESVMRSFNPMRDLRPLRDFRFCQDR